MKNRLSAVTLCCILGLATEYVSANTEYVQGTVLSDKVFYQIGGGSAIMPPPLRKRPNELAVGLGWKMDMTCGNFDIKTTVKNQLNGITEGFKDLYSNVIQSATGAVASLPALIIQRANPQLYDILSNGMYQAKLDFDSLKTSCEAMSDQLADYTMDSKWAKAAGLENYKKITSEEPDAKKAKKKMEEEQGKNGISWIGGEKRGGMGQKAIDVLQDVVGAGFNMSVGRGVTQRGSIPTAQCDGRLCSEWQSPEDAAEYARRILGDKTLTTCETCGTPTKSQAGTGLAPEIEQRTIEKMKKLEDVLNEKNITAQQLNELSTSTVAVTRGLIESLRESPDVAILGARLAQELAISHELEKALVLRRIILVGMKEPNVASNTGAQEELEKSLKMLDREIEQVKLEMDLQHAISNNTAVAILNNRVSEQQRALESNAMDNNRKLAHLSSQANDELDNSNQGGFSARDQYIYLPIPEGTSGLGYLNGRYSGPSSATGAANAGPYTKIPPIAGTALNQAAGLLRNFEGFSASAYWDVNAHRAGYGSDTITKADGTVVKITRDTVVTKEDAERDLTRRTNEFANKARRQLSNDAWDKLPPNAQAALTSFAYNYGSLKKDIVDAAKDAARTGDMKLLADAVRKRQTDNGGINARRRNQEADYILNN